MLELHASTIARRSRGNPAQCRDRVTREALGPAHERDHRRGRLHVSSNGYVEPAGC
jgi:hypothetical protein